MKIAFVFNFVCRLSSDGYAPENSEENLKRFIEACEAVGKNLDAYLCISGKNSNDCVPHIDLPKIYYAGGGWDVGAFLSSAKILKHYDMVFFLNSQSVPTGRDSFRKIVDAWNLNPSGLVGTASSFEFSPHLRTCAIGGDPKLIAEYPEVVDSRYDASLAEHSPNSISAWFSSHGHPVNVIYNSCILPIMESRECPNGFRKGDQSDLLISDKHSRIWDHAELPLKISLQDYADGIVEKDFRFRGSFYRWLMRVERLMVVRRQILAFLRVH